MNFQEQVFRITSKIPKGKLMTYQLVAKKLGDKNKARAVGNALNKNIDTKKVPCHRVVRSDGYVGGYALGGKAKIGELRSEEINIKNGKVVGLDKFLVNSKQD